MTKDAALALFFDERMPSVRRLETQLRPFHKKTVDFDLRRKAWNDWCFEKVERGILPAGQVAKWKPPSNRKLR